MLFLKEMSSFLAADYEVYLFLRNVLSFLLAAFIIRLLWNRNNVPKTKLYYNESSSFLQDILSKCNCLTENYIPTHFWGKSGHVQSVLHTTIGRFGNIPETKSERHKLTAWDGSVISYDIFESEGDACIKTKADKQALVLIVPGICNHAENNYIKAFTKFMNLQGFRVAVYNHTGALKSVELKRPRIFTYGQTSDLNQVVEKIIETENVDKLIGLGFSLGGNILLKYLGEKPERQNNFHFGTSVCAGYDVIECNEFFKQWKNLRFLYNYGLTRNVLKVVKHHKPVLAELCRTMNPPLDLNWNKIISAKALHQLDTEFTLKLLNEPDINEFYQENSSSPYLDKIQIPILLLNAEDDPMIPQEHHKHMKRHTTVNSNALFAVTPYGGHLGFYEGGYFLANKLTWMDRMLCQFFKVSLNAIQEQKL